VPNAEPVKFFVLDADLADYIAVVEPGPSDGDHATHWDGASRDRHGRLDPSLYRVDLSNVQGESVPLSLEAWQACAIRPRGAGRGDWWVRRPIFDMALGYAKERKQFDTPIGAFQAIQHKLAISRSR